MSPLTPKLVLSSVFGLFYGLLSYVTLLLLDDPEPGRFALIIGLGTFAVMLLILLLKDSRLARRYEKAEQLLPCPPEFSVGANFREDRRIASVNLYLCEGEMVLLNVHKQEPAMTRIPRADVRAAVLDSPVQLDLTLTDGRKLSLLTPYMEDLTRELRRNGWLITDKSE